MSRILSSEAIAENALAKVVMSDLCLATSLFSLDLKEAYGNQFAETEIAASKKFGLRKENGVYRGFNKRQDVLTAEDAE